MHTHYKGTGKVHSFRGLLGDGKQREINVQGSVGAIAWRITKFELMGEKPTSDDIEAVVKIYRERQSSIDGVINFTDDELLAAGYWKEAQNSQYPISQQIIFDNALFVRNIFVTHTDISVGEDCNYYIELEEVTVSASGKAQLALAATRRTKKY